jgi:hypothetical protein
VICRSGESPMICTVQGGWPAALRRGRPAAMSIRIYAARLPAIFVRKPYTAGNAALF